MTGRGLFGVGVMGSLLTAVCCATPILAIVLGALGLSAWVGWSDYIIMPVFVVFLAITVYGLLRSRQAITPKCCEVSAAPGEPFPREDGTGTRHDAALSRRQL